MDILCSHHLVICPGGSTDYRELIHMIGWSLLVLNLVGKGGTGNMHPCDPQVEGAAVRPGWNKSLLDSLVKTPAFARTPVIPIGMRP
jgi:hypothetical protein